MTANDLPEPDLPDAEFCRLRVSRIIAETHDARSLELDVPNELSDRFRYRPGQFLTLRVPSDRTGSVGRCYSLSSAPHEDGPLKVTVKRVRDGYGSNWLCDNASEGMAIDVLPPAGVFTPKSLDNDLLLFAGGSGITPIMSILKSVLARGTGRVTLIYANRDENSVIFASALTQLSAAHPDRLTVLHWLETVQGLPTVEQLAGLAQPWADREVFICGPGAFMDAASAALTSLNVERRRIHIEKFISLSRNPFEVEDTSETDAEDTASVAEPASLKVDLDGGQHAFSWPRNKKLLDFLLEKGLDAPYSCREGACSACACRIVSGDVKMLHNEVLEPEDLDDGIVLACQSLPVTDDVAVSYE
ncbi:ferredoxin--NADP reductase [Hoyosella altamirensis]|uniref:3-ketosteroid 9alpha-monooxygenase subunit B n=1 Tax=Hoyosella altamirensis TaxID=616997 RepID=A0A839RSG1_9ACTN|nr:ferredoxin--NADP reductase [Hoyosella altamirensis]MBB3039287.1 3-ketosteroid 9alpha-monooxygenase subunit B [Hoyosella altamirensis]